MAQGLLPAEVTEDRCDYPETSELHVGCICSFMMQKTVTTQKFLENYAKINLIPEVQRVPGVGDANVIGYRLFHAYLVEAGCNGTI